jgi:hypothetical protein
MKRITFDVAGSVYAEVRRAAQTMGRPTSDLIREAMEAYVREHLEVRRDLTTWSPASSGGVVPLLRRDDDLLEETS